MSTAPPNHQLVLSGSMLTDTGRVRLSNEDAVAFVNPGESEGGQKVSSKGALIIVADGMGGHAAGEVASAMAVEIVRSVYYLLDSPPAEALSAAFAAANKAILDHSEANPSCRGMGTTCTAIAVRDGQAWLAHVGDSRAYLLRGGGLTQLSEDQSLHAKLIRDGLMSEEDARTQPGHNYILQALGTKWNVAPDIWGEGLALAVDDTILLCSDGLSNLVEADDIALAMAHDSPQQACRALVERACAAGGHDNISVGIFKVQRPATHSSIVGSSTRRLAVAGQGDDAGISPAGTRVIKVM